MKKNPRILLSNDDGIHAHGFSVLERIARSLSDDVWVCAPSAEQSAASHSLTIHRPVRLGRVDEKRYTVDGTPTDCVLLAVNHIMADQPPDLVLSGVNHGRNIAEDVTYSGTIAAAMEATLLGIPAIAFSQSLPQGSDADWSVAEKWGPQIAARLLDAGWPQGVLMNVNFPAVLADEVAGVAVVPHGVRKIGDVLDERTDPRGRSYFWIGSSRSDQEAPDDTDIKALSRGQITVTPLHLDLTHHATLATLKGALG
ncbi:5'/3'-nucleotidase SurE [Fodinicurvata sp. EGI_FJ10296]|uniref:5'/3'-nucleotidase SurE n=1 Tax=Fodinicurvata sp. EGI_FJ10296 TaxID=3231908 RepID=UPI003456DEB2